jgi:Spy/CpxP family protein refolding chaperone
MKTKRIFSAAIAFILVAGLSFTSMAQRGQGMNQNGQGMRSMNPGQRMNQTPAHFAFLQLSEEQQSKIETLRLDLMNKNLPLKNQLDEMRAKMKSLQTGDNQSLKDINKLIDDMSAVQAQIRKNAAAHRLDVRALLTDDQKVLFDAHQGWRGKRGPQQGRMNKGNRNPRGNGFGQRLNR